MAAKNLRFVGNYDINAKGHFLWEILAQLRGFGVGRIVTKSEWGRKWPTQPSYIRIVRAEPHMDRWLFGGRLFGEWTYRGKSLGLYEFADNLNRSDWRLIHKHEEPTFTKCEQPMKNVVFPKTFPLPPVQVMLAKKEAAKRGVATDSVPTRAKLTPCIDPEFRMFTPLIKQEDPKAYSNSIYDEANPEAILDLYGEEIPVKVEAWNYGPSVHISRFTKKIDKVHELEEGEEEQEEEGLDPFAIGQKR
ncbi:hypothetical protein WR25_19130 [Diploscapter pachys]|uniref:28S ribosomal protein S34, mitochondrial n=1 Tax=Diploscapter pachys TaxID=2018661 RepID=A0A2A2LJH0_9BILA|nr:hypothetical protein WR25_19130 [Diploscapter pachys]